MLDESFQAIAPREIRRTAVDRNMYDVIEYDRQLRLRPGQLLDRSKIVWPGEEIEGEVFRSEDLEIP